MTEQRYQWMIRRPNPAIQLIPCSHLTEAYSSQGGFESDTPIKKLHPSYKEKSTTQPQQFHHNFTIKRQQHDLIQVLRGENAQLRIQVMSLTQQLSSERKMNLQNCKVIQRIKQQLQACREQLKYSNQQQQDLNYLKLQISQFIKENMQLKNSKEQLETKLESQDKSLQMIEQRMAKIVEALSQKQEQIKNYKWILDKMKQQDRPRSTFTKQNSSITTADNSGKKRCDSLKQASNKSHLKAANKLQQLNNLWTDGLKEYSNYVSQKRLKVRK